MYNTVSTIIIFYIYQDLYNTPLAYLSLEELQPLNPLFRIISDFKIIIFFLKICALVIKYMNVQINIL